MPTPPASTPLMRQYRAAKQQVPDALLMFRLGDFYELFFDDALVAARDLEITLTSRNKEKGEPIPMCGVPVRTVDGYVAKLIEKGHRVAVCDQVEEAGKTKKLVRREITRIVTPGTASDDSLLRAGVNNYLAALVERQDVAGLAYVDVSTGDFHMTELSASEAGAALENIGAREVLVPSSGPLFQESNGDRFRTELEPWIFEHGYAEQLLKDHYGLHSLDGLGAADHGAAVSAAGALLHYLRDTQRAALGHLDRPTFYAQREWMALDPTTVRNLELVEPLFGGAPKSTLLAVIDQTSTSMGARLLRQWLLRPSLDRAEIESRLGAVAELRGETITRTEIRRELERVLDIERLLARVTLGSATPRDVAGLGGSLRCLPMLRGLAGPLQSPRMLDVLSRLDELADVRDRIVNQIAESPPLSIADGGVIAPGVDQEIDELRDIQANSRGHIAAMETRERERTGIGSLKIRHNNVFGFYIEVSKANIAAVPDDYDRKQTLVNAERFITPELKEYEQKVVEAEDRIFRREKELFEAIRAATAAEAQRIRSTAAAIAELDVFQGLALTAAENNYSQPQFNDRGEIQIVAGRHPVIEALAESEGGDRFIPNDGYLNANDRLLAVITGPNMGGKSTYLRQIALTSVMAQIGSFVPATSTSLSIVDRIFTRIGATDSLARGRSTFMVEMTETAEILNAATPNSLILLDEIGRGTSTFDGLAIAWAVVEHIQSRVRAKTLFATHYNELTELADLLTGVFNLHVSVKEAGDRVIFLRKVEPGKADRSYGIEVARLAGLPIGVVTRAREVLRRHERGQASVSEELSADETMAVQVPIFSSDENEVLEQLRSLDLNELKPIEALTRLSEWRTRLEGAA